jgi:hypothetical protein
MKSVLMVTVLLLQCDCGACLLNRINRDCPNIRSLTLRRLQQ